MEAHGEDWRDKMKKLLLITLCLSSVLTMHGMQSLQEQERMNRKAKDYGTKNNPVKYTASGDNVAKARGQGYTPIATTKPVLDSAGRKVATVKTIYRIQPNGHRGSGSYTVKIDGKTQRIYFVTKRQQADR